MALLPGPGRLLVTEPPVPDEPGIILPPNVQGADLQRYLVVEVGEDCKTPVRPGDGVHVHAQHFAKIGDAYVIDDGAIVAYEPTGG